MKSIVFHRWDLWSGRVEVRFQTTTTKKNVNNKQEITEWTWLYHFKSKGISRVGHFRGKSLESPFDYKLISKEISELGYLEGENGSQKVPKPLYRSHESVKCWDGMGSEGRTCLGLQVVFTLWPWETPEGTCPCVGIHVYIWGLTFLYNLEKSRRILVS